MIGLTSPTHIVLLLGIALLLFGAKRLPEIGKSLGHGMREFKDSVSGLDSPAAEERATELTPAEPPTVPAADAREKEAA
jgi:sec-independent protein translocase protein TatA